MTTTKPRTFAQQIVEDACNAGIVHLGGEMEFPINKGAHVAFCVANDIACQCGYIVQWKYGQSAFEVSGGDIPGRVVLDWYARDNLWLGRVEVWTCQYAYLPEPK